MKENERQKIRILLADDHSVMRMGLSTLIGSDPDMTVVGEADNGMEAVRLVAEADPDVVIMDLMMPALSGAEATKRILAEHPGKKILILTSYGSSGELADAMRSGASGALTKDAAVESILDAIRTVAAGGRVVPDGLMANMRENLASARLTTRQLEILDSVRRGLSNQDIARQLGITVTGVKKHMQAIFAKLGVSSRAEAVGVAMHRQLLKF